ncbi:CoA transferase [Mycobacterium sp. MAA66]|uniref:CaiB/BaiF CoA-transferase family protein n=1 Tax=Mycobacterium sp. MAA66 TaxID=3156297 RepID=UPI00351778C5
MVVELLAGLRVLDVGSAESDGVGRLLADLGADVLKIEPAGGAAQRGNHPRVAGVSLGFIIGNANKRCATLDPGQSEDRDRLIALAAEADIVIDGGLPGQLAAFGTSCAELADRFDTLVAASITDFGADGPRATWQATDAVLYALSTALSRSGPTSGRPVLPPDGIASATAAVQAAWAVLVAYFHRLRCGRGDYLDFSRFEGVLLALDPPFGSQGQAASGQKTAADLWRGRPRDQQIYPTFGCRDGFVRICLLSPRQWRGMRAWLGEPAEFADPKFDTISARYAASDALNGAMGALFATASMADLVAEGQRRGVPIAAMLTPAAALDSDHFRAVGALAQAQLTAGTRVTVPTGPFVVDDRRAGFRRSPCQPGTEEPHWATSASTGITSAVPAVDQPLAGLRILDLGVIVAGGELGRLFADLGAEVIKIESASYPDGLRQKPPGQPMSRTWALTHRNEYSLGLDLRTPRGREIFGELVRASDAVFANFKPGTLAALGFSTDRLHELNPGLVLAESSAFGASGPWSDRMGYGPLVRANTGVSQLWTSGRPGDDAFYDATTVFPDHVVARVAAIGALAALIHRQRAGSGAHVHISQAEVAVNVLATTYVAEAARGAGLTVEADPAVHGVYPCAGDDEWCVISLRGDSDRSALATVLQVSELPSGADELDVVVSAWTAVRSPAEVVRTVQDAGVPAGPMNRAVEVLGDPQVLARGLYADLHHPLFEEPMPAETGPTMFRRIGSAPMRPAPQAGEHTREICSRVLGLGSGEVDDLIDSGAVFEGSSEGVRA